MLKFEWLRGGGPHQQRQRPASQQKPSKARLRIERLEERYLLYAPALDVETTDDPNDHLAPVSELAIGSTAVGSSLNVMAGNDASRVTHTPGSSSQYDLSNATLITGPTTITRPGLYRLANDIVVTSGNGINIQASDVIIDLDGHQIIGRLNSQTTGIGIWAISESNITIRNGTIRGFMYGIYLSDYAGPREANNSTFMHGGHLIESMQIYDNTFRGIRVEGHGNVVRDNIIQDIGGTSVYANPLIMGIESYGPGATIQNNVIYAIRGHGYGISITSRGSGSVVDGNTIANSSRTVEAYYSPQTDGTVNNAFTMGIRIAGDSTRAIVSNNLIINYTYGVSYQPVAEGLVTGNVVSAADVPYHTPGSSASSGYIAANNDSNGGTTNTPPASPTSKAYVSPSPYTSSTGSIISITGPTTITRAGHYRLERDIVVTSGNGINVKANNVIIDLNGYSIIGLGGPGTRSYGIWSINCNNITIRNGTIRGFFYGIYLSDHHDQVRASGTSFDNGGHLIEGMRLIANTFRGIRVEGRGNVVRGNLVQDTGGTTVYSNPIVMGIESYGPGALIAGNTIYAIRGTGYGISISSLGGGTIILANVLTNSSREMEASYRPGTDGTGRGIVTWGIWVGGTASNTLIARNEIINFAIGVAVVSSAEGIISSNIVSLADVPFYVPGGSSSVTIGIGNQADADVPIVTDPSLLPVASNTSVAPAARTQNLGVSSGVIAITEATVITVPGYYRLERDIVVSSGYGINILASDVVLDLNGYSIICTGGAGTRAIGIAAVNRDRITIRNGSIIGFMYGIYLSDNHDDIRSRNWSFDNGGHLIEGVRLVANTFRGIRVEGRGNIIRGNIVQDTGGTTVYGLPFVMGIEVYGPGALVEGNSVYAIRGTGYGISLSSLGGGSVIRGNVLSNSALAPEGNYRTNTDGIATGNVTWGIWVGGVATRALVSENQIINFHYGVTFHSGADGLLSGNNVTQSVVPYYTPGIPEPLAYFARNNYNDHGSGVGAETVPGTYVTYAPVAVPQAKFSVPQTRENVTTISGPTKITRAGIYRLDRDISVGSGIAIEVVASDVIIDLNGHRIIGPTASDTTAIGIYASNQDRITVRNGTIQGFMYPIFLYDSYDEVERNTESFNNGGHLVEDMKISLGTFRGMRVEGRGNVIRNNIIQDIGGSTVYSDAYAFGIEVFGPGAVIEGNIIYNTRGGGTIGEGVGISVSRIGSGIVIRDNIVANSSLWPDVRYNDWRGTSTSTYGIWIGGISTRALVTENLVINYKHGITFHAWSDGLLTDNDVSTAVVPFYTPARARDAFGRPKPNVPMVRFGEENYSEQGSVAETVEANY